MTKVIVTTTINPPTEALRKFGAMPDWELVVIGDKKTPSDFHIEGATYVTEFLGTRRDDDHVGVVLARVEGLHPRYTIAGDELYVRATITSSLAPENPVFEDQLRQAWVQPVRAR